MPFKIPSTPPALHHLLQAIEPARLGRVFSGFYPVYTDKNYRHWDELIHFSPPGDLTREEWWAGMKLARTALYQAVPLCDTEKHFFQFLVTESMTEQLHRIDLGAGENVGVPGPVINPETRDQYYVSSLLEEAITSSQLEGATTTREVAKEMIRTARPPQDRSERMIHNNYLTMQHIGKLKKEPLSEEFVFDLHRLVTQGTLEKPDAAGRFRNEDGEIVVQDVEGRVLHKPPQSQELSGRMKALCDFANGKTPEGFVHPVLRSIILHFWLAYDHPFVDGNGRTARALFYWSMLHQGYWLCEFVSISRIILQARIKYSRAFLYTESDGNDLTYFLLYHIEVLRRAVEELHTYIHKRAKELEAAERKMQGMTTFNHRQRALLTHAMRHPNNRYTIEGHRSSHNVVYQTARNDLRQLAESGVMDAKKSGQTWYFTPRPNLEALLAHPR